MSLRRFLPHFQSLETPFYFYDMELLRRTLAVARARAGQAGYQVHYAMKANVNDRILQEIIRAGFGADCVSGNEVARALEAGFERDHVVFAGVGKTDKEIRYGLEQEIFAFNVESIQELETLEGLAGEMGCRTRYALRINPHVDAGTHEYITTGTRDNKFGITVNELIEALP